jgi:hypothetical protein
MDLFNSKKLPNQKQPDGFTVLQNGNSYNDLVDEHTELIIQYNALLEKMNRVKAKGNSSQDVSEEKSESLLKLAKFFRLLRNGLSYKELNKKYLSLTANFNQLTVENYELSQEIQRLNNTK